MPIFGADADCSHLFRPKLGAGKLRGGGASAVAGGGRIERRAPGRLRCAAPVESVGLGRAASRHSVRLRRQLPHCRRVLAGWQLHVHRGGGPVSWAHSGHLQREAGAHRDPRPEPDVGRGVPTGASGVRDDPSPLTKLYRISRAGVGASSAPLPGGGDARGGLCALAPRQFGRPLREHPLVGLRFSCDSAGGEPVRLFLARFVSDEASEWHRHFLEHRCQRRAYWWVLSDPYPQLQHHRGL